MVGPCAISRLATVRVQLRPTTPAWTIPTAPCAVSIRIASGSRRRTLNHRRHSSVSSERTQGGHTGGRARWRARSTICSRFPSTARRRPLSSQSSARCELGPRFTTSPTEKRRSRSARAISGTCGRSWWRPYGAWGAQASADAGAVRLGRVETIGFAFEAREEPAWVELALLKARTRHEGDDVVMEDSPLRQDVELNI